MDTTGAAGARGLSSLAATALAVAVVLAGCGSLRDYGPRTTQDRGVPDGVTAVELRGSGSLAVRIGDAPQLQVTAGENVIDRVTDEVEGSTLVLDVRGRGDVGPVEFDLVLTAVDAVRLSGSGDIEADLEPGTSLRVVLDGSGNVRAADIDVDDVTAELSGSGRIELAGTADAQDVTLDGSGAYDAADLTTTDATVSLEGSGDLTVHVTGTLDASVEGSGSIVHSGGADVVRSEVDGSGRITEDD